jgi:hypothetical protein
MTVVFRFKLPIFAGLVVCVVGCQPHGAGNHPDSVRLGIAANGASPSAAASFHSSRPPLSARVRQEISLHAALYRAAFESRVSEANTSHFLLEPVRESDPPELLVEPSEFRAAVLNALADLNAPIAWVPETWCSPRIDYFPGTTERATRLKIKIINRDENHATVTGEIGDSTTDVAASRQRVTATWDGECWNIDRDRVKLVW